jgi:hypothetical protein
MYYTCVLLHIHITQPCWPDQLIYSLSYRDSHIVAVNTYFTVHIYIRIYEYILYICCRRAVRFQSTYWDVPDLQLSYKEAQWVRERESDLWFWRPVNCWAGSSTGSWQSLEWWEWWGGGVLFHFLLFFSLILPPPLSPLWGENLYTCMHIAVYFFSCFSIGNLGCSRIWDGLRKYNMYSRSWKRGKDQTIPKGAGIFTEELVGFD